MPVAKTNGPTILAPFLFPDRSYLRAWLASDENEVISSAPRSAACREQILIMWPTLTTLFM
jgi:hypothetical protein